jgi:magnesium transporter
MDEIETIREDSLETYQSDLLQIMRGPSSKEEKRIALEPFHQNELAQTLPLLTYKERLLMYELLASPTIADMLAWMEPEDAVDCIREIPNQHISTIFQSMQTDDLADVIDAFEEREERVTYLSLIDLSRRMAVKTILDYDEKVVGSIMNTTFVVLDKSMSVKNAIKELVRVAPQVEFINNLFVVEDGVLIGVLSLKEIMAAGKTPEAKIDDLMTVNLITVHPTTPSEEAAEIMKTYDFMLLPVVDHEDKLLGVVSFDDIADVINEESDEDYSRLAGLTDVNLEEGGETVFDSIRKRMPWLVALLFINMITSGIVAGFEHVLSLIPILAMFMPLILNMAGNSGTQSLGVIIRLFATNQLESKHDIRKHLFRELLTGLVNGLLIGAALFLMVVIMRFLGGSPASAVWPFAFVVSLSIVVALMASTVAGAMVPLFMKTIKVDPAVASGPFITTINDIIALLIYFGMASLLLERLL